MRLCESNVIPRLLEAYSAESGTWKDKNQNGRVVSRDNCSRHQVRSFLGGLLDDQQVHIVHILRIIYYTAYYGTVYM